MTVKTADLLSFSPPQVFPIALTPYATTKLTSCVFAKLAFGRPHSYSRPDQEDLEFLLEVYLLRQEPTIVFPTTKVANFLLIVLHQKRGLHESKSV